MFHVECSTWNSFTMGLFDAIASTVNTGLSIGGALYTNHQNMKFAKAANAAQIDLAKHAHQYEVADLRAAGLNPILSAGGNGLDVPSLASNANQENPLQAAQQWAGMKALLQNAASQEKTADAQMQNSEAAKESAAAASANAAANNKNAETARWALYDAKAEGLAGFKVMGFGSDANMRLVQSLRINKVTGECYDMLTGKPVRVVESVPVSSARDGEVTVRMEGWKPDDDDAKGLNNQLKAQRRAIRHSSGLHFPGAY